MFKKFIGAIKSLFTSNKVKVEPLPKVNQPESKPAEKEEPKQDRVKPSWYLFMLQFKGKSETDSKFNAYMSSFWPKSGLNFKTIAGSKYAWCGLAIFVGLYNVDMTTAKNAFRAMAWDNYGYEINYKVDGIPQGAIIRINNGANCKSSSNNHVTMADGDCSPADLNKSGATFNAFGGNQGNKMKVSTYSVRQICYVGWPKEAGKPPKITKSVNCGGKSSGSESTR